MTHWVTASFAPRNLNRRDCPLGRSLVSVDLTADETPATGCRRRFALFHTEHGREVRDSLDMIGMACKKKTAGGRFSFCVS